MSSSSSSSLAPLSASYALVEIKCEDTLAFYQGYVKDVDRDMVLVAYEGGWQRDAWLSVTSVRPSLAPYNLSQFNPLPGEVVEVKAKSAEHEPYSWWRGSVKSVRPNPALAGFSDSLGSTTNQLIYEISYAGWESEFSETLESEMLRPFNKQPCFTPADLEKHVLPIAPHMAQLLTNDLVQPIHYEAGTLALVVEPAGSVHPQPPPKTQADAFNMPPAPIVTTQPHIHVIGTKQNCQRAVILLAQQLKLLNEIAQQQQHQPQYGNNDRMNDGGYQQHNRYDSHPSHSNHGGYGNNNGTPYNRQGHSYGRSNSPLPAVSSNRYNDHANYSAADPPHTLEFHCPPHLMGMVIGKRHKNLYIAENLDGIYKVHVDTDNGSIVVLAKSAEAANGARSLLELTEQTLQIPSVIVGRVVGKNFSIIKEIEQHSGVLRIKVGDDRDHDMEFLQQLAINGIPGVQNDESRSGHPLGASSTASSSTTEKRSAFALMNQRDSHNRHGRSGFYDRSGGGYRGGRYQPAEVEAPEEFDIVALDDDKKVEISIIGSPATVSEAELLLRTHIGLITQIYKLSYDEAMLKREVDALSLVVPGGGANARGPASAFGGHGGHGGHSHGAPMWNEKRGRGGKMDDANLPAWAVDRKEEKLGAVPVVVSERRKQDPSSDIHAARLQGISNKPTVTAPTVTGATAPDATSNPADSNNNNGASSSRIVRQRGRSGRISERRGGGNGRGEKKDAGAATTPAATTEVAPSTEGAASSSPPPASADAAAASSKPSRGGGNRRVQSRGGRGPRKAGEQKSDNASAAPTAAAPVETSA